MMDPEMQQHVHDAVARIGHVLERGADVEHAEVQAAVNAVVAFRNRAIERHRARATSADLLDRANALLSLAYGAEFPLSGLHRRRFEQTRAGMQRLLETE
jgi:hypothetical protein